MAMKKSVCCYNEEIYHEPHELVSSIHIRTKTRYVQKVRDIRVVSGRNSLQL